MTTSAEKTDILPTRRARAHAARYTGGVIRIGTARNVLHEAVAV
jgi:hypothetical protein